MKLKVANVDLHVHDMRTRMPFKYGIATMSALPHLLVRVELLLDNRRQYGYSADHLPPKWFTKNPDTSTRHDLEEMAKVIEGARAIAPAVATAGSVYELWREIYQAQAAWAGGWGYPPLLAHFGTSLMERAIIDAFCRAEHVPFAQAVRENRLGVRLAEMQPELEGAEPRQFLPDTPLRSILVRHTIGLGDPLTEADIPADERINDGLPQSLEACIRAYGLTHFKIKLWGDASRDVERVRQCAEVIERWTGGDYAYTLDGNENFKEVDPLRAFWATLSAEPSLKRFLTRLIFVEQPLHRDVAMNTHVQEAFRQWPDRPPMIVDESDAEVPTARKALDMGYAGTSHKNCKGVIKSIANACLIEHRRRQHPGRRLILSSEDLCNVGPIALPQDLCVAASLGIPHVERNGHHYFRGLSVWPDDLQEEIARAQRDLYRWHEDGFVTPRIDVGRMQIGSVVDAPFGVPFKIDTTRFTPFEQCAFDAF